MSAPRNQDRPQARLPDESRKIYAVDWKAVAPVLHILRAFRIALHPSKLLLGLTFILLLYGVGRLMDGAWPKKYSWPTYKYATSVSLPPASQMGVMEGAQQMGPFMKFLNWELESLRLVTDGVISLNLGLTARAITAFVFEGPLWLFTTHPVFAILFTAVLLLCWAIFGGAIARIAAVHVTRDEKISIRNALRFSVGKVLSFGFAPLILAIFLLGAGAAIAAASLVLYIPQIGPLVIGLAFIFILIVGFVMTLTLFGAVGGFSLMYPTVAVEGSDAFDAISTSFSYVFAKPLRLLGYTVCAIIYGALSYLLVKWFVFILFALIHGFMAWFLNDAKTASFNLMFPPPEFDSLSHELEFEDIKQKLGIGGTVGASIIAFWYSFMVALLGAFVLSFYFSVSTILYTLLRHDVERTELDDVYLESEDEEDIAEQSLPDAPIPTHPDTPPAA